MKNIQITNRKFSLQNHNEIYYGDVFIGYQIVKDSDIIVGKLNLDIESGEIIHWTINDTALYRNKVKVLEIKNRNFNNLILDKLNWVCPFKEEHTHYVIKCKNVYISFLTTSYREAVKELIRVKNETNLYKNLPVQIEWEIKPIYL